MTAEEWSTAYEPLELLAVLSDVEVPFPAKFWRYAVLCLDGIGEQQTVELLSRIIDGNATESELDRQRVELQARVRLSGGGYSQGRKPVRYSPGAQRARAGLAALEHPPWLAFERVTRETKHLLQREQCAWLRCLFSNPFRPAVFDAEWLTSTVVSLARGIYDDRAFDRMPILCDALQDAGCENEHILNHCRSGGPHVRGCWIVDLLLGKE